MTSSRTPRITQRRIAELAGVSQATVSLVLNGRTENGARIPEETRERVLAVIRQTTYVADPVARSLAGAANNLVGVFTYEHAFPNETSDFYTPLLTGIESRAEALGFDLLMFTSAPLTDGRRQIFNENSRLRLADGCLLLGSEMDADELARLRDSGYAFVAIGRRDVDGIAYVGVDYVTPTQTLARKAVEAGHRSAFYAHLSLTAESSRDRHDALTAELARAGVALGETETTEAGVGDAWRRLREGEATVLFVEDPTDAEELHALAAAEGIRVPEDLSVVVLGERGRGAQTLDFTRLSAPRTELGSVAVTLLDQLLNGPRAGAAELPLRQLLDCTVIDGATLAAPSMGAAR
ncbi:LacI family DNA-binding transcriptional regulator [Leifsonia poae]|uniref:LacI family DNA-binding transcriptional regulator n=1 Tax=Leifsonia poae TaxID=110933 RepID=UPI001CBF1551|nr:LacI family DNA-binding transcriptional regulator [Leifsonia poae]